MKAEKTYLPLSSSQRWLLHVLCQSDGYVACDGEHRAIAHQLEGEGLAEWKGTRWGSSFWGATGLGRQNQQAFEEHRDGKSI